MKLLVLVVITILVVVAHVTAESDFEKRYGKYARCKQTHKATDEELEVYITIDNICRQKARHAYGGDGGDDFNNKLNCVKHCIRNHTPSSYGDHISYCVQSVDEGTYIETSCKKEY